MRSHKRPVVSNDRGISVITVASHFCFLIRHTSLFFSGWCRVDRKTASLSCLHSLSLWTGSQMFCFSLWTTKMMNNVPQTGAVISLWHVWEADLVSQTFKARSARVKSMFWAARHMTWTTGLLLIILWTNRLVVWSIKCQKPVKYVACGQRQRQNCHILSTTQIYSLSNVSFYKLSYLTDGLKLRFVFVAPHFCR